MDSTTVVIDDDDIAVVENKPGDARTKQTVAIVDLGDETESSTNNETDEELANHINLFEDNDTEHARDGEKDFVLLLKSNNLMNKIIQKCLNIQNNEGMLLVINKTLIPLYKHTESKYKQSKACLKILRKVLENLKRDPRYKFSHIKTLCEELKKSKCKKNNVFVSSISDNTRPKRKKKQIFQGQRLAKNKANEKPEAIIDLDNSDEEKIVNCVDIEDSNSENDDVEIVTEETNTIEIIPQTNKENYNTIQDSDTITHQMHEDLVPNTEKDFSKTTTVIDEVLVLNKVQIDKIRITPDLDQPFKPEESVASSRHSNSILQKAIFIEKKIEMYKKLIDELEEQEIVDDSRLSPYIQCDKHKAKIVALYRELCKLTNNGDGNLMKHRVVRLRVSEGYPPGPVRRLEKFLNSAIDETGAVTLPDFHDVMRIVKKSNLIDKIGWNSRQIMNEAMVLFTRCCQALRKCRQKREYKDLMSLLQDKALDDYDPANEDPLLLARLEDNKRIATANEKEVIERFAKMEDMPKTNYLSSTEQRHTEPTNSESESEVSTRPFKRIKPMFISNTHQNAMYSSKLITNSSSEINLGILIPISSHTTVQSREQCSVKNQITINSTTQQPVNSQSTSSQRMQNPHISQTISNPRSENQGISEMASLPIMHLPISQTISNTSTQPPIILCQTLALNKSYLTLLPFVTCQPLIGDSNIPKNDINCENLKNNFHTSEIIDNNHMTPNVDTNVNGIQNDIIKEANIDTLVVQNNMHETQVVKDNMSQIAVIENSLNKPHVEYSNSFINCVNTSQNCSFKLTKEITPTNLSKNTSVKPIMEWNLNKSHGELDVYIENNINTTHSDEIDINSKGIEIKKEQIDLPYNTLNEEYETYINSMTKEEPQDCSNVNIGDHVFNEASEYNLNNINVNYINNNRKTDITFNFEGTHIYNKSIEQYNSFNDIDKENIKSNMDSVNSLRYSNIKFEDIKIQEEIIDKHNFVSETHIDNNTNINPINNIIVPNGVAIDTVTKSNNEEKLTAVENVTNETQIITSHDDNITVKVERTEPSPEPINVQELLDQLGDNYISTIFDVEDPFLIIEISSDSSSDEDL